jgi:hypothetical protein
LTAGGHLTGCGRVSRDVLHLVGASALRSIGWGLALPPAKISIFRLAGETACPTKKRRAHQAIFRRDPNLPAFSRQLRSLSGGSARMETGLHGQEKKSCYIHLDPQLVLIS